VARTSAKGTAYATALLRVDGAAETDPGEAVVSVIAFGETATELLTRVKGDAVSVAGRLKMSEWTTREGEARHGLSLTAERILTLQAKPKAQAKQPEPPPKSRQSALLQGDARLAEVADLRDEPPF
jgi:single-stranded DNA-binding protein